MLITPAQPRNRNRTTSRSIGPSSATRKIATIAARSRPQTVRRGQLQLRRLTIAVMTHPLATCRRGIQTDKNGGPSRPTPDRSYPTGPDSPRPLGSHRLVPTLAGLGRPRRRSPKRVNLRRFFSRGEVRKKSLKTRRRLSTSSSRRSCVPFGVLSDNHASVL